MKLGSSSKVTTSLDLDLAFDTVDATVDRACTHDDVHTAAAGCVECILVPSFKLAARRSAFVLSKTQTWG